MSQTSHLNSLATALLSTAFTFVAACGPSSAETVSPSDAEQSERDDIDEDEGGSKATPEVTEASADMADAEAPIMGDDTPTVKPQEQGDSA